jgi:hypothetical protein
MSRPALERALADLLADVVAEVNAGLEEAQVDIVFRGSGGGGFAVEVKQREGPAETADGSEDDQAATLSMADAEKLTLRLPADLKERASASAVATGVSLNAWIVRAIARELDGRETRRFRREFRADRRGGPEGGSSLRGWVGGSS